MKIYTVITTKNRIEFLKKATTSVAAQTRKPDKVIVVSDSNSATYKIEKDICDIYGYELIIDRYNHNYAGSLNTAMHFIIENLIKEEFNFNDAYIALLDDDDIWTVKYLEKCEQSLKDNEDFVISGLVYCNEDGERKLSIPQNVTIDDFLKGNPHIQGSNTFIKFSTLLKAGLFDENMSSTTDRDIFVRTMMLKPTYVVLNEYLVYINAYNDRERITNGVEKKANGLQKFYYKYNGFMSNEIKDGFFSRAQTLFHVDADKIINVSGNNYETPDLDLPDSSYKGNLLISFIATEYKLGLRLLKQLISLKRENTKIIILVNFEESTDEYKKYLSESNYDFTLLTKTEIADEIINNNVIQENKERFYSQKIIKDIATARSILQYYLYKLSYPGDVVWILDEDMELKELIYKKNHFEVQQSLDVDRVIAKYKDCYDAVVGNYTLDAPLPALSTLRCSLVDYMYNTVGKIQGNATIDKCGDYYYDLTDEGNLHLETPLKIEGNITIDDVFTGKAIARPLFVEDRNIKDVKSRGGNTIIFNRELLKIPNWSLKVNDMTGRRSDYFWVLIARKMGYKLVNVPFATLHNRSCAKFDYDREINKFTKDLIGSSFTKAVECVGINSSGSKFFEIYTDNFKGRLNKFIASYYRIIGLLSILSDDLHLKYFNEINLQTFIHACKNYLDYDSVTSSYATLRQNLQIHEKLQFRNIIQKDVIHYFEIKDEIFLLGYGSEAVVLTDKKSVYKCFFEKLENEAFLKDISVSFNRCCQLYPIEIFNINGRTVLKYKFEESIPYSDGMAKDFSELIAFAKTSGFIFDNFKKENFIVVNGVLKLVDYGKAIAPYTQQNFIKSIKRCYEMIRYPFLTDSQFKSLIKMSYRSEADNIDFGWEIFAKLIENRYKEQIHDEKVIKLIKKYRPSKILDYGAGKCKIANTLAGNYSVDVFDIDTETINRRASEKLVVYYDKENIPLKNYDLVLCNLVLCCVNLSTAEEIIDNIAKHIKDGGHVIFSICNPFFNEVKHTELRLNGIKGTYHVSEVFDKIIKGNNAARKEYHRPIETYVNLLQRSGFIIVNTMESDGVDADTLMPISEHLILDCCYVHERAKLYDCSLMIKTNPMEYKHIYKNIQHIVCSLEKGIMFREKVVVIDMTATDNRARKYDEDNSEKLISEINRAKTNGLIDKVVMAKDDKLNMDKIYGKYFGMISHNGHSTNGQGLYATLCGFEEISTRYVFQTDSDILYSVQDYDSFYQTFTEMKNQNAITATIGVAGKTECCYTFGKRTEVRTCFLDLQQFNNKLPMENFIESGQFKLPWHRTLDKKLQVNDSLRFCNKNLWFVHPENQIKNINNYLSICCTAIEKGEFIDVQINNVNLMGDVFSWVKTTNADVVIYIRGFNTPIEKLKRMFDSLACQTYSDYFIVYVDDASDNGSAEYAKFILNNDYRLKEKNIAIFNDVNIGEMANFLFVMQNVIKNKDAIVINLDNDDCFIKDSAVERIIERFNNGTELTCGNCIRYDKPLKKYKICSFENVWERNGDNIWLHPKCFRRYLFDSIDIDAELKIDGEFVKVNSDFAFMLPMIAHAKRCEFIDEVLYFFEPSIDNVNKTGVYSEDYKQKVKQILLLRAKELVNEK